MPVSPCMPAVHSQQLHDFCAQPLPLRGFDEEVRNFVAEQYGVHGLNLHPAASPVEIRKDADGKLTLVAESKKDGKIVLEGLDHVLMATGRKPNTRGLGCEEVRSQLFYHCLGFRVRFKYKTLKSNYTFKILGEYNERLGCMHVSELCSSG